MYAIWNSVIWKYKQKHSVSSFSEVRDKNINQDSVQNFFQIFSRLPWENDFFAYTVINLALQNSILTRRASLK